jgi:tight adherence protein B
VSSALVCGMLLAGAVLVQVVPARRPGRAGVARARSRTAGAAPTTLRDRFGKARTSPLPLVADVMTEVAARLRAGAPVYRAWQVVLARAGFADGPIRDRVDLDAAFDRWSTAATPGRWRGRGPRADEIAAQLLALRTATRLADHLGAPLADVLDRCSVGVVAAGQAEAARRVALAGPTSTARLLTALPLVGLLLGVALGVDPGSALLDGGLGSAAGLAGLALLVVGHRWTSRLVEAARGARASRPVG